MNECSLFIFPHFLKSDKVYLTGMESFTDFQSVEHSKEMLTLQDQITVDPFSVLSMGGYMLALPLYLI